MWAATSIVVSRTFEDADYGEEDDGESELSKVLDEAERLFPCADIGTAED